VPSEQITPVIQEGSRVSIATDLRPRSNTSASGEISPSEGQTSVDYDVISFYNDMLLNGKKNMDGRAFDRP